MKSSSVGGGARSGCKIPLFAARSERNFGRAVENDEQGSDMDIVLIKSALSSTKPFESAKRT